MYGRTKPQMRSQAMVEIGKSVRDDLIYITER